MSKGIGDNLGRAFTFLMWAAGIGGVSIAAWIGYGIYKLFT